MATSERSTTALFQIIWLCISGIIVAYLIADVVGKFKTYDIPPQLLPIVPEQAIAFGGIPAVVRVGLNIATFSAFDVLNNDFVFTGTIWFEFDPSLTSLDTVRKFTFEKGEILSISEPSTKILGDKLFASFDITVKKKDNLNHAFFPFSGHTFHAVVDHKATPGEIVFESTISDLIFERSVLISGWRVADKEVATGYSRSELESGDAKKTIYHPRVIFAIDFAMAGVRQLVTIFLPLILIFYITLFSFAMDPEQYYRSIITLSSGSITAMLAYRFVIENLSPKVGYFMLSDYIFFLFLGASCIIFLVNTRTLELGRRPKEIVTVLLHAAVIIVLIYLLKFYR